MSKAIKYYSMKTYRQFFDSRIMLKEKRAYLPK